MVDVSHSGVDLIKHKMYRIHYRFESCPDYEEMIIFLYGIQSVKLENLSDKPGKTGDIVRWWNWRDTAPIRGRGKRNSYRFKSCPDYYGL